MTPEHRNIPDWAQQARQADLDWISHNLDVFRATADLAFEDDGRGAIFVDTTIEPVPGAGRPFAYLSQEHVEEFGCEDARRMVVEYDPAHELVLVRLKSDDRTSTYRGASPARCRSSQTASPTCTASPTTEQPPFRTKPYIFESFLNVGISTIAAWCRSGRLDGIRATPRRNWWIKLTPEIIAELRKPVRQRRKNRSSK